MITGGNDMPENSKQRQHAKLKFESITGLKSVKLSHGSEIEIVDISREGMVLETDTRLRPDLKVVLKIVTGKDLMRVPGVVLRSAICSLAGGPRYRSAVEFTQPLEVLDEAMIPAPATARVEDAAAQGDAEVDPTKTPAILTVWQAATVTSP